MPDGFKDYNQDFESMTSVDDFYNSERRGSIAIAQLLFSRVKKKSG